MKVLFVHPERYLNIGVPAGISILSAILKQRGHDVALFDTTFMKVGSGLQGHELADDKSDLNIAAGDNGDSVSNNRHEQIYKKTEYTILDLVKDDPVVVYEEEFQRTIDSFAPDLIAISSMTTTFDFALRLLRGVRHKAKVIVGGVHPTIATDDCLAQPEIDIACIGEADEVLPELCDLMDEGRDYTNVKSMHFRMSNGSIKKNGLAPRCDLNNLPCPDWSMFDERHLFRPYDGKIYKGSFYSQSRGCPMSCTYCVDPTISKMTGGRKGYFRIQDPSVTYAHLKELKEKYGATWFKFVDDTFLLPPMDHLEELAGLIKPLNIKFGCSVMPNTIKEEKVKLAREMGCVAMSIGIESGNPHIREMIMRRYNNTEVVESISMVKRHGLRVSTFNIIGFPTETRENVFETVELNRQLRADACNVYILYPYPGTPIAIRYGIPVRGEDGKIPAATMASRMGLSSMSQQELEGLQNTFNFYLHLPKSLWPIIGMAESPGEVGHAILNMLGKLTVSILSGEKIEMEALTPKASERTEGGQPEGLLVPVVFCDVFELTLSAEQSRTVADALGDYATDRRPYVDGSAPGATLAN